MQAVRGEVLRPRRVRSWFFGFFLLSFERSGSGAKRFSCFSLSSGAKRRFSWFSLSSGAKKRFSCFSLVS